MYEADLKGADAQVVAWEADDDDLKNAFRRGVDIHVHNATAMWGSEFTRLPEGSHRRDRKRQDCKIGIHLTDYGGSAKGMAQNLGWLVHEADKFQKRWFALHPAIRRWHDRIRADLERNRTVYNVYGFRRQYFARIDTCFTEALAWVPQSTVALNTYDGAFNLEGKYFHDLNSKAGILLQTHDSLNFQFPKDKCPPAQELRDTLAVVLPYDDPLTIPWDLKRSERSWGEMEKVK